MNKQGLYANWISGSTNEILFAGLAKFEQSQR